MIYVAGGKNVIKNVCVIQTMNLNVFDFKIINMKLAKLVQKSKNIIKNV